MIAAAIRHPALTLLLGVLLGALGWWSWSRLAVDAIPDLSDNQVIVWAAWPGQAPEDVDRQVTTRLAQGLNGMAGVQVVRGLSLTGSSYVYAIFDERRRLADCRTQVQERLSQLQGLLPTGVTARLGPEATAMGQIFAFTLDGPGDAESKRFALDQTILPALQAVAGVAEVAPAGGVVREYHIDIDPQRLEELGLTLDMVMMAVRQSGRDVGAMAVERNGIETMLRGVGFVRDVADLNGISLRSMGGAGVTLGQVARIRLGGAPRQGLLADERGEQVGAIVALRAGEDPSAVIAAVKHRLEGLVPALGGLVPVPFYDRSDLIGETTATLVRTLVEELVVTVLVVSVFLLHVRASLAVAVVLPLGVLATFAAMHALGVGANLMSLAGIAIAIGVMVDFGIVMSENITQHLTALQRRRPVHDPRDPEVIAAIIAGAQEVSRPLMTAAATTVIGFLPLFLLTDQAGRLFIPLAITKTLAIGAAVVLGMLLVPALCRLLLPPWQIPPWLRLGLAGLAGGFTGGWLTVSGVEIPLDHGRVLLAVPGWLVGPVAGALAALLVARLGGERLVDAEENPVSRVIHTAYDWAYTRLNRQRPSFALALVTLALAGWLIGLGWSTLSWPLRQGVALFGGDLAHLRVDRALADAFPGLGSSFLPPLDEGALLFMPSVPATAGLGETQRVLGIQNRRIAEVGEVALVMGKMGRAETALDPAPLGMIETIVLLKPYRDWPVVEMPDGRHRHRTLAEVRTDLAATTDLPGVAPSWLQPIETRVVMLSTGIRAKLALQLAGQDLAALDAFATQVEPLLAAVPGAADVQMQREGGKPYGELRLDLERLNRFGLTPEAVLSAIESGLGGMPLSMAVVGNQRYGIRLRIDREQRDDTDEIDLFPIPVGAGGHGAIPLAHLLARPTTYTLAGASTWLDTQPLAVRRAATPLGGDVWELTLPAGEEPAPGVTITARRPAASALTWTIGPMAIRSESGQRLQYVLLNTRGRGEVDVVRDADARLRAALARGDLHLPPGVTWRWVGNYEQKLKADATMRWVIGGSLAIMLVLIWLGTRSLLVTGIIVTCNLTVSCAGGFLAVWFAGAEMTTAVAVGFLVLLGVMFNDGILLGTYLHQAFATSPRDVNDLHARVFAAGLRRRRPALMTNCTTLLALIPILWAEGRGAEVMRPMVLPVIGGMIADLLSLFSVPVLYTWWWERRLRKT